MKDKKKSNHSSWKQTVLAAFVAGLIASTIQVITVHNDFWWYVSYLGFYVLTSYFLFQRNKAINEKQNDL